MMKPSDRIQAEPRGDERLVFAYFQNVHVKRRADFNEYVEAIFDLASQVGVDPSIAIAQASLETDKFRSYWWNERLNPAGIGITGDPQQNARSRTFANGRESARAQLAHLMLYATGTIQAPLSSEDDPRYDAYLGAYGNVATAETIADLSNSWAVDDKYAEKIITHGNSIFPTLDDQVVPRVRMSPIVFRGQPWEGYTNARVNGILFRGARRTVTVRVDNLNLRVYADTSSEIIRTATRGERIPVIGWVRGQRISNEDRWWIGADYTRIWVGGTSEKPT